LYDVEILFDSPLKAAIKINEVWNDVQNWWQRKDVQKAVRNFCYNFARSSKTWRKQWTKFIISNYRRKNNIESSSH